MIFMILTLLLSFTSFNSLNAMGWWWTEADYIKHTVFVMAYNQLAFGIKQQNEEISLTYTDYSNKNTTPTSYAWSLDEAHTALNTITSNKNVGLPTSLKKTIKQHKSDLKNGIKKEETVRLKLDPKIPITEQYNLACGYLQWLVETDPLMPRIQLCNALSNKDVLELKKLFEGKTYSDEYTDAKKSFKNYIIREAIKIVPTPESKSNCIVS